MASDKFRRQLRQEATLWQAEGLIASNQYQQLAERYQFEQLETASRDRFVMVLIGIGSILLGLSVITFVAANWQAWPRAAKMVLLLGLLLGVNIAGFYLWCGPQPLASASAQLIRGRRRLGEGLLLLGALILGANLALMAQMFHISGDNYALFLVWGVGVALMAYSLELLSLSVLSILLISWGYITGSGSLSQITQVDWSVFRLLLELMPLVAVAIFLPLAYLCRSRLLFTLMAILAVAAFGVSSLGWLSAAHAERWMGWAIALVFVIPPALLWAFDDLLLPRVDSRWFRPRSRFLSLFFLAQTLYFCSFHWAWSDTSFSTTTPLIINAVFWVRSLNVLGFVLGTGYTWGSLLWGRGRNHRPDPVERNSSLVIASFLGVVGFIPLIHWQLTPIPVLATFLFNVILFILAIGLIRHGLERGHRHQFWSGTILLTLQILSRMVEYDTDLLFKSFVFLLCGVGVIVAGLWFERHLAQLSQTQSEKPL